MKNYSSLTACALPVIRFSAAVITMAAAFAALMAAPSALAWTPVNESFTGTTLPASLTRGGSAGSYDAGADGVLTLSTATTNYQTSYVRTAATDFTWAKDINKETPVTYQFTLATPFSGTGRVMLYLIGGTADSALLDVADPANARTYVMGLCLTWDSPSSTYNVDFYQKTQNNIALVAGTKIASLAGIDPATTTFGFTLDGEASTVKLFAGSTSSESGTVSGTGFTGQTVAYLQMMNVGGNTANTVTFSGFAIVPASTIPEPAHAALLAGAGLLVLCAWRRHAAR
ncbi:hypothetical protein OpiT1DRAFT_02330 [Opitutaceae bacterium TAV1]|nr:hypothetical protein OpiT1DRAFT_02330 [Opitutaceae bacterium TAV1]